MHQVIVYPRGQLTHEDRQSMKDAGVVAVEADDPSKVVTAIPGMPLATADDLFMAALYGMTRPSFESGSSAFILELHRRLKEKEKRGEGAGRE